MASAIRSVIHFPEPESRPVLIPEPDSSIPTGLPFADYRSTRDNFVSGGLYGTLEPFLQGYRAYQPLDLHAPRWREKNPRGSFQEWRQTTKAFVIDCLHYDPGPVDLKAETLEVQQRDGYRAERVAFNTAPWSRVEGWFLCPDGSDGPFPAVILLHSWGGPMLLGKDRYVSRGKSHPRLIQFLKDSYSGRFMAEDLVRRGYAVLVIDAFHFGSRLPWGAWFLQQRTEPMMPPPLDPLDLDPEAFDELNSKAVEMVSHGNRYLRWAGTTWAGVNFWDDSRCVDYLVSRPEVDPSRIGCVGHSGGGWRAHLLAGLDDRIAASVSSCWTTIGHWQHLYSFVGTVGYFSELPDLWRRLDVPDLALLAAPRSAMVISGQHDHLFAPEGMEEAARQIADGFSWAGMPDRFRFLYPPKAHCFHQEEQNAAWAWFDRWLRD